MAKSKTAEFQWHLPFMTKGGDKARLIGILYGRNDPYAVAIRDAEEDYEYIEYFYPNGKVYENSELINRRDLVVCDPEETSDDLDLSDEQKDILRRTFGL